MSFQRGLLTFEDLIKIEQKTRTDHSREYIPNVIEPSFGIGRILYASRSTFMSVILTGFRYSLCEQVFWTREGAEERAVCHHYVVLNYKV